MDHLTETVTWIAVEDQLPPDESTVLGFNLDWDGTCAVFRDPYSWHFVNCGNGESVPIEKREEPTHWAPMPRGPQED